MWQSHMLSCAMNMKSEQKWYEPFEKSRVIMKTHFFYELGWHLENVSLPQRLFHIVEMQSTFMYETTCSQHKFLCSSAALWQHHIPITNGWLTMLFSAHCCLQLLLQGVYYNTSQSTQRSSQSPLQRRPIHWRSSREISGNHFHCCEPNHQCYIVF